MPKELYLQLTKIIGEGRNVFTGFYFFNSPGHMAAETGNAISILKSYPLSFTHTPITIMEDTQLARVCALILRAHGIETYFHVSAKKLLREIFLNFPNAAIDNSLSHLRFSKRSEFDDETEVIDDWIGSAISPRNWTKRLIKYYTRWNTTKDLTLIRAQFLDQRALDTINRLIGKREYVAIQIKTDIVNGTASVVDPQSYHPLLAYLNDCNVIPVLIGRERYPEQWRKFNVINYANSNLSTPYNDFLIILNSIAGITTASGLSNVFEILRVPYLMINSFSLIPNASNHLMVPSMILEKGSKTTLSFSEQIALWVKMYTKSGHPSTLSPDHVYRPPDSTEILRGFIDLGVIEGNTFQQKLANVDQYKQVRNLDTAGIWRSSLANIAPSFFTLNNHYLS